MSASILLPYRLVIPAGNGSLAPLDDVFKVMVHQQLAVSEYRMEPALFPLPKLLLPNDMIFTVTDYKCLAATLRGFLRVGLGLLVDVFPLAIDINSICLLREWKRIAVNVLEQTAAHTQVDIVSSYASTVHLCIDLLEGLNGQAVTLCYSDVVWKDFVTFRVSCRAELSEERIDGVGDNR